MCGGGGGGKRGRGPHRQDSALPCDRTRQTKLAPQPPPLVLVGDDQKMRILWLALTCNTVNATSCKWRSQCARRHWTECGNESLAPIWAKVARATLSLYWPTVDCLQTLFSTWGAGMQLLHFCRTQYFYDFDIKSFPSFWRIIIFDGGRSWDFGMFKWQIIHSIWRGSWNNPENQDVDVLYNNLRTWTYGTNYV